MTVKKLRNSYRDVGANRESRKNNFKNRPPISSGFSRFTDKVAQKLPASLQKLEHRVMKIGRSKTDEEGAEP
jgi:hypothetical protein